ncbi:MAG: hypothetical protein WCP98_11325 [Actinomycetes bacterium]
MKIRVLAVLSVLLLMLVAVAGCGGGSSGDGSGDGSGGSSGGSDLSDTIVLPAGWEMLDAVSVADVEAVVGATGYKPWSEPLSDAAAGKPQGGYATDEGPVSKINFLVYTKNGQAEYDRVADFVENPTPVTGDLWDQAIIGDLPDAGEKLVALLVRRGDVCMRILWDPAYYSKWDQTELGVKLATMLIENLYGK